MSRGWAQGAWRPRPKEKLHSRASNRVGCQRLSAPVLWANYQHPALSPPGLQVLPSPTPNPPQRVASLPPANSYTAFGRCHSCLLTVGEAVPLWAVSIIWRYRASCSLSARLTGLSSSRQDWAVAHRPMGWSGRSAASPLHTAHYKPVLIPLTVSVLFFVDQLGLS